VLQLCCVAGKLAAANYPDIYQLCRDNTRLEWKLKTGFIALNLTIVTSRWLTEQASRYAQMLAIHHIPYGIDTEAYQP